MKILFLSDDFPPTSFGGAGIIAFRDAAALAARGHEISIITITGRKEEAGAYSRNGLRIRRIYSDYPERWRAYKSVNNRPVVRETARIISELKPDIVHAHNIHTHISYASLKAAKKSGAKVFMTLHDAMAVHYGKIFPSKRYPIDDARSYRVSIIDQIRRNKLRYNPMRNIRIRHYLSYVDGLFAVSAALKLALEINGINDVVVLHNGISLEDWRTDQARVSAFKAAHGLNGKRTVLFAGRLSGAKGANAAIGAFRTVSRNIASAALLIAGSADSPGATSMKELAEEYGVAGKLVFTGWLEADEMRYAIASSDVVAALSVYLDPFPTINLEAMASKKPVVGTRFGGTAEIVEDGKTGYIVDPRDETLVAEKIADLLEDPEKAGRFGDNGYERVKDRFSLERHIDTLVAWYNGKPS